MLVKFEQNRTVPYVQNFAGTFQQKQLTVFEKLLTAFKKTSQKQTKQNKTNKQFDINNNNSKSKMLIFDGENPKQGTIPYIFYYEEFYL